VGPFYFGVHGGVTKHWLCSSFSRRFLWLNLYHLPAPMISRSLSTPTCFMEIVMCAFLPAKHFANSNDKLTFLCAQYCDTTENLRYAWVCYMRICDNCLSHQ
jgi:hypothetical protein